MLQTEFNLPSREVFGSQRVPLASHDQKKFNRAEAARYKAVELNSACPFQKLSIYGSGKPYYPCGGYCTDD
ncbi:hypothetical protein J6590_084114 [Homalodisca vitripennis]|nr:hypothetical protein J6590_084114 [Homalodisca vitripennis]